MITTLTVITCRPGTIRSMNPQVYIMSVRRTGILLSVIFVGGNISAKMKKSRKLKTRENFVSGNFQFLSWKFHFVKFYPLKIVIVIYLNLMAVWEIL